MEDGDPFQQWQEQLEEQYSLNEENLKGRKMSIPCLILGQPGTGKSSSLRKLDPAKTLLIQVVKKPLPFRSKEWTYYDKETCPNGNIFVTDVPAKICKIMKKTRRKVICLDDSNYVMSNAFLRRSHEKGYDKFTEMANDIFSIFDTAAHLAQDVRVYIFGHTQLTDDGIVRFKTIGKLLDEKVSLDGLVTICLRTVVRDGTYCFATKNSGSDTVKAPIDLFSSDLIENDLSMIDAAITEFYALNPKTELKETLCTN
ncbi:MAG: hypothetical protein ON057_001531 [Glomeribacter sp. 1016415]|nr:hypothetical protein [Glomeribacter sp. 1016415]